MILNRQYYNPKAKFFMALIKIRVFVTLFFKNVLERFSKGKFWEKKTFQNRSSRFRGTPQLRHSKEEATDCKTCHLCSLVCPSQCIDLSVDGKEEMTQFKIDMGKCLYCGLCEEACSDGKLFFNNNVFLANINPAKNIVTLKEKGSEQSKEVPKMTTTIMET
jgi:formate hydrogenlyase subunit 6/NADH:ubiquinone oxidoreductase subunit I